MADGRRGLNGPSSADSHGSCSSYGSHSSDSDRSTYGSYGTHGSHSPRGHQANRLAQSALLRPGAGASDAEGRSGASERVGRGRTTSPRPLTYRSWGLTPSSTESQAAAGLVTRPSFAPYRRPSAGASSLHEPSATSPIAIAARAEHSQAWTPAGSPRSTASAGSSPRSTPAGASPGDPWLTSLVFDDLDVSPLSLSPGVLPAPRAPQRYALPLRADDGPTAYLSVVARRPPMAAWQVQGVQPSPLSSQVSWPFAEQRSPRLGAYAPAQRETGRPDLAD